MRKYGLQKVGNAEEEQQQEKKRRAGRTAEKYNVIGRRTAETEEKQNQAELNTPKKKILRAEAQEIRGGLEIEVVRVSSKQVESATIDQDRGSPSLLIIFISSAGSVRRRRRGT